MKIFFIILILLAALTCFFLVSSIKIKIYLSKKGYLVISYLFIKRYINLYGDNSKNDNGSTITSEKSTKKEKPGYVKKLFKQKGIIDGTVSLFKVIQELLAKIANVFSRSTVENLRLKMTISQSDPAETAVVYGAVSAIVYPAIGLINGFMPVKNQEVDLKAVYDGTPFSVEFSAIIKIHFRSVFGALYTFLREYIKTSIN